MRRGSRLGGPAQASSVMLFRRTGENRHNPSNTVSFRQSVHKLKWNRKQAECYNVVCH